MSRDLVLDVIAKKNSRDLSTLADEFDRLARQTDDAGKKMHQTGTFSEYLDDQLAKTRVQVRELGEEVDRTGNKDLYAKLRGAQTNLRSLERIKADLTKALKEGGEQGGDEAGRSFSQRFRDRLLSIHDWGKGAGGRFTDGFTSGIKPGLITSAILAGAMVTPGVVLAATGLAGIGLGVVGQLKSPAVIEAAHQAGHRIMDALAEDTKPFEGPIIQSLDTLAGAAESALGQINFGTAASEVESFASGIGGLISRAMPGFNAALEAAQPIIDTLSADLPLLGDAVSQMFDDFSKGGRGAQESIHMLMATLAGLALIIGKVVLGVSNLVEHIVAGGERLSWWAAVITANVPIIGAWANGVHNLWNELQRGSIATETAGRAFHEMGGHALLTADQLGALQTKLNEVELTAGSLAEAMSIKVLNSMMSLDQANLSVAQSLNQVADAFRQNGREIDIHKEKGEANRQAVLAAVAANIQQYQALVQSGVGAVDAAAAYDQNTAALEAQLHKAHLTQGEIDQLIGKYRNVPDKVNTDIATQGLTDAINGLSDLIRELNGLPTRKSIDIFVQAHTAQLDRAQNAIDRLTGGAHGGNLRGYASGGRVFEVGEMGKELLELPALSAPAYVTPNSTLNGAANRSSRSDEVIGVLEVVHRTPTGEVIVRELVTLGRRTNRKTFDTLIPVGTAK